jgi:hypothetical protein
LRWLPWPPFRAGAGRPGPGYREELHGVPRHRQEAGRARLQGGRHKYAGQKDAVDKLAAKIMKGGAGVWGPVPMPANAQVNEAEAKKLAAWVLSQK